MLDVTMARWQILRRSTAHDLRRQCCVGWKARSIGAVVVSIITQQRVLALKLLLMKYLPNWSDGCKINADVSELDE